MGEVYRAKDTRLDRVVALKVLPSDLSSNPERRQRLEREARAISRLSHPHICALYDIGHQDGVDFIVMEYVEGETLEQRLQRGVPRTEQVLEFAIQISDALANAHRQGVIHRDLKPGNIMLTKSGAKLLDFGLAKLTQEPLPVADALTEMTAEMGKLTTEGMLVGTFQYMAPEQLEGKDADRRTDIFAFGTVLFEMATGRPAFTAKSRASLIASILTAEPPAILSLQPMSPPSLDRVVRKCLEKDPDERWQSAKDLNTELRWIAERPVEPQVHLKRRVAIWVLLSFVVAILIAAAALTVAYWRPAAEHPAVMRFSVLAPEQTTVDEFLTLSPDGTRLAFSAIGPDQVRRIWVRPLDSQSAQALPGTEGAAEFFWSPDSRYLAFFTNGKLERVDLSGGTPEILCNVPAVSNATWSQAGVVLFSPGGPIQRLDLADCAIKPATQFDASNQEIAQGYPQFLPDNRHFLWVTARSVKGQRKFDIYASALDSTQRELLVSNASKPSYVLPGILVFAREGKLLAVSFDAKHLRVRGETFPIVREQVNFRHADGFASYSVSNNGVLVYEPEVILPDQLQWVDRAGKRVGVVGEPGFYQQLHLSPEGKRIAVKRMDPQTHTGDIWIYDIPRNTWTRLTFMPTSGAHVIWSPDGREIAFKSGEDLYKKPADGSRGEEQLLQSVLNPDSWSPDGRFIVYAAVDHGVDIWMLPLFGERKPVPLLQTQFNEGLARISPDGNWMAYESDESGRWEVYVRPMRGPPGRWQLSSAGAAFGVGLRWNPKGKEVFYVSADWKLMSVPVTSGVTFQAGVPKTLFALPPDSEFDIAPDGQRFLTPAPVQGQGPALSPISVVLNWTAEFRRLIEE